MARRTLLGNALRLWHLGAARDCAMLTVGGCEKCSVRTRTAVSRLIAFQYCSCALPGSHSRELEIRELLRCRWKFLHSWRSQKKKIRERDRGSGIRSDRRSRRGLVRLVGSRRSERGGRRKENRHEKKKLRVATCIRLKRPERALVARARTRA